MWMCSHNCEHNLQFCPRPTLIFSQLQPEAIYKIIIVKQTPMHYTHLPLSCGQENMLFPWRHNIASRSYTELYNNNNSFPKHIFCVPLSSLSHSFLECVALYETESLEIITQLMKSSPIYLQYPRHHHCMSLTTKHISRSFRVAGRDQQANNNDPQEAGKGQYQWFRFVPLIWGIC